MHNLVYHQNARIGNSGSRKRIQRDRICTKPTHKLLAVMKSSKAVHKTHQYLGTGYLYTTSIDVDIFLSLILSYFCLFVPAFRPCHGKLVIKTDSQFILSEIQEYSKTNRCRHSRVYLPLRKYIRT
jgi:hypothetical protein